MDNLTDIQCGEIVLRQTIRALNSHINGKVKDYNFKKRKQNFTHFYDYNDVHKEIAERFLDGYNIEYAKQAYIDGQRLYDRMKYPTLVSFNNFLERVCENLDNNLGIAQSIYNAKKNDGLPQLFYHNYQPKKALSSQLMKVGIDAVENALKEKYNFNGQIYLLDVVITARKDLEASREAEKNRKKIEKELKVANSKKAEKVVETCFFGTNEFYEKDVFEKKNASQQDDVCEDEVQLFDENDYPVVKTANGFVYNDGTPCLSEYIYDESRNVCYSNREEIDVDGKSI